MAERPQVTLENEILRAVCLPGMGGKIISLFYKEKAFEAAAQAGKNAYGKAEAPAPGARQQGFARYAYGLDDAFPNIDEEDFLWKGKTRHYPDHGQIWDASFRVLAQGQDWVKMRYEDLGFSYSYKKDLCLVGNSLRIQYKIENIGKEELPAIWTWHGLMRYEEDMEILLPEGVKYCRNVFQSEELGEPGTVYPYQNPVYDFCKVPAAASMRAVKYYVEPKEGAGQPAWAGGIGKMGSEDRIDGIGSLGRKGQACCGFSYPSQGMRCTLHYDAKKLPYLGVWITAGGFQGDYNCALEPSNGFYDSVGRAAKNNRLPVLAPGETIEFDLRVSLIFAD